VKLFFISLLFFLPTIAEACKAGPLPDCKKPSATFSAKKFERLQNAVDEFQQLLSETLIVNDKIHPHDPKRTSCFNNLFAQYYLRALKEFAKSHGNKICELHAGWVAVHVKDLIDEKSMEWQEIKVDRTKLQTAAKKVDAALVKFLPAK